jgi:hypothetical protein
MSGKNHNCPVNLPEEDVFVYDEEALRAPNPWKALKPYGARAKKVHEGV